MAKHFIYLLLFLLPLICSPRSCSAAAAFVIRRYSSSSPTLLPSRDWRLRSKQEGGGGSNEKKKKGYQFGDITKSLLGDRIKKVTGKDTYEFGDLSRWLDEKAKSRVNSITGKESYGFGDLSRWVDTKIKDSVNDFTGQDRYEFGHLTKEIARRVSTRDYTLDDLFLLLKILLSFGAGLTPVASFLPLKLLVELLNYSIVQDVGGRVSSALAMEVDRRMKHAVTGDADYKIGDLTQRGVLRFIGKDEYAFGDITRAVVSRLEDNDKKGDGGVNRADGERVQQKSTDLLFGSADLSGKDSKGNDKQDDEIDAMIMAELERWDEKFQREMSKSAQEVISSPGDQATEAKIQSTK